jgi:hypothetical protein
MKVKCPGAIILLWSIFSFVLAIVIYVKMGGTGQSRVSGYIIAGITILAWFPMAKFLGPSWQKENESLLFGKIERLISKGKFSQASKIFDKNEIFFKDKDRALNIKNKLKNA